MLDELVATAVGRGWLPSAAERVVLAPSLGLLAPCLAADPILVSHIVRVLQDRYSGATITLAGSGLPAEKTGGRCDRSGLASLSGELGLRFVDLSAMASGRVELPASPLTARSSLSVRLPALALTSHILVTLAPLLLDPYQGLCGALHHQLSLIPDLCAPHLRSQRSRALDIALTFWAPDLCILDARDVVVRSAGSMGRPTHVHPKGCLLAGSHPAAVDRRAAAILSLTTRQVPILRDVRRLPASQANAVVQFGEDPGPVQEFRLHPSAVEERLLNAADRLGLRLSGFLGSAIRRADLPRVIDFVRRAGGSA